MSRESLFRAKQIVIGEWFEGNLVYDENIIRGNEAFIVQVIGRNQHWKTIPINPETICQYSELTDMSKTKIFENDIVKVIDSGDIGIVKFGLYDEKHYGFYVEWVTNSELREDIYFWTTKRLIEVVGNIFDNPELLKGDEE